MPTRTKDPLRIVAAIALALAATPRRGSLLYKKMLTTLGRCLAFAICITAALSSSCAWADDEEAMELGESFGFKWRTGKSRPWNICGERSSMQSWDFRSFDESGNAKSPNQGSSWVETTAVGPTRLAFLCETYMLSGPFRMSMDGNVVLSEDNSTEKNGGISISRRESMSYGLHLWLMAGFVTMTYSMVHGFMMCEKTRLHTGP